MNNLFFSYEVKNNDESQISKAIESLGNSTKLHSSCWYVNSKATADEALKAVARYLNEEDSLVISDTTNNTSAWFNVEEKREIRVKQNWGM